MATSLSSAPYVKLLPDAECMTTGELGSCCAIASKMGNFGKVEAILSGPYGIFVRERYNWTGIDDFRKRKGKKFLL